MKRFISALLAIILIFSSFAGLNIVSSADDLPASGKCGENVTYTFDSATGTLVISGSGEMANYIPSWQTGSHSPFYNQIGLKYIIITSDVTSIGNEAFVGCSGLTSVAIPNSVKNIGDDAFSSCSSLKSVTIPDSVTSIGGGAFSGCSKLTNVTIGNSVISIGVSAFSGCSSLASVNIPDSVKSISWNAFNGCSGLTSITIPNSVKSIDSYTFNNCSGLTSVTIPGSVTRINSYAFNGCNGLTSVVIPNSVTSIGAYAFRYCSGLTSVTIPDSVISIGSFAFSGCTGLTRVSIPNSVTRIGEWAFHECSSLTSMTIPNSVISIGRSAFSSCSRLTSVNISDSITSIESGVFSGCSDLTNIDIPDSVTSIGDMAFSYCGELRSIIIPNSVNSISNSAFEKCSAIVIYGKYGSKAEEYAKSHNIRFVEPSHQHNYVSSGIVKNSTCSVRGQELFSCICGATYKEFLPLKEHTYQKTYRVQKATPSKQGKITKSTCSVCGIEGETQTIFAPKEIILSTNSFTYSGKQCKPAVTVKDSAGNVIDKSNYTIAYSNNINAGTAKVTVTFKGEYYEGSMSKTFKILPKKLTNCYLDNTFTYTGKPITPVPYYYKTVVQTFDGEQYTEKALTYFKKGTEYTIAVSGKHTQVGTYTVIIRFCGNYTGTVKKSIQICPKPVTKSNIKPYSETSIKISWNKVACVSGYSVFRYNIQKSKWERYKNTTATSMIVPRINASYTDVWLRIWTYQKVGEKVYYNESGRVHYTSEYTKPSKPIVKLVNTDFGNFVIKFNRVAWHQTQLSDNKAFSNKGENICVTYRNYNEKVTATGWGSAKKYYVRSREYFYDNNNKLVVGPWSDIKTITTY